MGGYYWSKLPQEIKDLIYKEVLLARQYIIIDPEPWARLSLANPYSDPTPAYAGMMLASKETSTEMQEVLYKHCIFRAYLCKAPSRRMQSPRAQQYERIQKIEIHMDLAILARTTNPSSNPGQLEVYYREWFDAIGNSGAHRDFCRIRITSIVLGSFHTTPVYRQLLRASRFYTGFRTVIVELGGSLIPQSYQPHLSQRAYYIAGDSLPQAPAFAGQIFEGLKASIARSLEPYLGPCIYYDRDEIRCLEFRPRTDEPIAPGCAPFV